MLHVSINATSGPDSTSRSVAENALAMSGTEEDHGTGDIGMNVRSVRSNPSVPQISCSRYIICGFCSHCSSHSLLPSELCLPRSLTGYHCRRTSNLRPPSLPRFPTLSSRMYAAGLVVFALPIWRVVAAPAFGAPAASTEDCDESAAVSTWADWSAAATSTEDCDESAATGTWAEWTAAATSTVEAVHTGRHGHKHETQDWEEAESTESAAASWSEWVVTVTETQVASHKPSKSHGPKTMHSHETSERRSHSKPTEAASHEHSHHAESTPAFWGAWTQTSSSAHETEHRPHFHETSTSENAYGGHHHKTTSTAHHGRPEGAAPTRGGEHAPRPSSKAEASHSQWGMSPESPSAVWAAWTAPAQAGPQFPSLTAMPFAHSMHTSTSSTVAFRTHH